MMVLTGNNTNSGTITIGSGTLQIGDGGTSGSLGSGPVVNQGTLAIDRTDTLTVPNVISGSGSFIQNGSGTVILSGINTYTGPTTVSSGKLSINGAITGGGVVTVGSGASLAGSGSVAGATTLSSGATLSPGNSPGTFTFGNGLTLSSGSTLSAEINGTTAGTLYDQVVVVGSVNLTGATLSLTLGYTAAYDGPSGVGDTFTIINNDGSDSVVGTFSGLPEGGVVSVGAQQFQISYVGLTGNDVTLKTVCFAKGTWIETAKGPVRVEDLSIGDSLVVDGRVDTAAAPQEQGCRRAPVRWIGRQTIHPVMAKLHDQLPVKISAGALGPNLPLTDLFVSPDHAVLFDGTLIHAKVLINGSTITQVSSWSGDLEYFHIETEDHELVFANGLRAETFIDNVCRSTFENYAEFEAMYPDAPMMTKLDLPRVKFRRQLSSVTRARLAVLEAHSFANIPDRRDHLGSSRS
jgi:autotransporter-associated beta strand protein